MGIALKPRVWGQSPQQFRGLGIAIPNEQSPHTRGSKGVVTPLEIRKNVVWVVRRCIELNIKPGEYNKTN